MDDDLLKRVRQIVLDSPSYMEDWDEGVVRGRPEFFRGDSWQMMLDKPRFFLRACLLVRGRLKGAGLGDTRISVGIGPVGTVDEDRISLSSGEAFQLSGRMLDSLDGRRIGLALSSAFEDEVGEFAGAICRLCDSMVSTWKPRQAEIASWALSLRSSSPSAITSHLAARIAPQTVGKSLRSVHFDALNEALRVFESGAWLEGLEAKMGFS